MPDLAVAVIWGFAILVVKHTIADFFLQTPYQYLNKGTYGHPGGILHSGIHVLLTTPVFLVLPASAVFAFLLLAGEFVLHYHIDWFKEQITKRMDLSPNVAAFWHALGLDQMGHMLTYVGMVALLAAR